MPIRAQIAVALKISSSATTKSSSFQLSSSVVKITRARQNIEVGLLQSLRIILCFWETELESCHSSLSTYSSSDSNRTQNIELGYDKVELLSAIELGSENHTRARQNIELGLKSSSLSANELGFLELFTNIERELQKETSQIYV